MSKLRKSIEGVIEIVEKYELGYPILTERRREDFINELVKLFQKHTRKIIGKDEGDEYIVPAEDNTSGKSFKIWRANDEEYARNYLRKKQRVLLDKLVKEE